MAIASLVLGLLGVLGILPGVGSILAIYFGKKAIRDEGPSGTAQVGIVLGWIGLVLFVLGCLLLLVVVLVGALGDKPSDWPAPPPAATPTAALGDKPSDWPAPPPAATPTAAAREIPTVVLIREGYLGVRCGDGTPGGAMVTEVIPGSPAEKAGLRSGDVITEMAGTKVRSCSDLAMVVRKHPGERVDVTVRRGDNLVGMEIVLGSR